MFDSYKTIRVDEAGPILHVQFARPYTGNTVTEEVLDELLVVLGALRRDPKIRVLVLSGAGRDFCLGGDRTEFTRSLAAEPSGAGLRLSAESARRVCDALATTNAVTIARMQGQVIGAGVALALFCDLRVGATDCRFRLPELALGLPMAWGGALPRLLSEAGTAAIRELILTGESFDAAKAERMSILHRVVPEHELDSVVEQWTRPLTRRPLDAMRTTKALLNAYSSANRLADLTLLDAEVMSSVLTDSRYSQQL